MNRSWSLCLGVALLSGIVACASPDDQPYDSVQDEEASDPDASLAPDGFKQGLTARIQYTCAEDASFFVARSDDGRTAVVTLDDQSVTLQSGDGARYLSEDAVYTLTLRGPQAFLDLGGEETYRDCERQSE